MMNFRTNIITVTAIVLSFLVTYAFPYDTKETIPNYKEIEKRISFKVKGNGKTNVTLGIGYQPGAGSCCTGVSKFTTVSFTGNTGDVLYDGQTRRVITKIYDDLEGTTIDLKDYY